MPKRKRGRPRAQVSLSRAAVALAKKLDPALTVKDVADLLGVKRQAVSAWLHGTNRPDPDKMAILQREYGIPMQAWTESP